MTAAVFVDRDGVVNELVPDPVSRLPESPLEPEQVALVAGAAEAIRSLRNAGLHVIAISNQPAAAKGLVSLEQLRGVHARVVELLGLEGAAFDGFQMCFHHPDGVDADLARTCDCRKPAPGMLLAAAAASNLDLAASWMVGDTDADMAAGTAAGCRTVLIENPASAHKRAGQAHADVYAPTLAAAAARIIGDRR